MVRIRAPHFPQQLSSVKNVRAVSAPVASCNFPKQKVPLQVIEAAGLVESLPTDQHRETLANSRPSHGQTAPHVCELYPPVASSAIGEEPSGELSGQGLSGQLAQDQHRQTLANSRPSHGQTAPHVCELYPPVASSAIGEEASGELSGQGLSGQLAHFMRQVSGHANVLMEQLTWCYDGAPGPGPTVTEEIVVKQLVSI